LYLLSVVVGNRPRLPRLGCNLALAVAVAVAVASRSVSFGSHVWRQPLIGTWPELSLGAPAPAGVHAAAAEPAG